MESAKSVKRPNCLILVNDNLESCPHCKVEFYNCSNCNDLVLGNDIVCKNCNSKLKCVIELNTDDDIELTKPY